MESPTYILVHGAWHGAWCWRDFTPELERRGVAWRAVDLPSARPESPSTTDLADDAAVVAAAAAGIEGPVVLVGHSYAGAVIAEASASIDRLAGLVYVGASVPLVGQSHSDAVREVRVRTEMDACIVVDGPLLRLDLEPALLALYQEATPEARAYARERISVQTLAAFRGVRTAPDASVRTRYVLCRHDHAIDPSVQEVLAQRCDEVVEMASDHCPFVSHPAQLADFVLG